MRFPVSVLDALDWLYSSRAKDAFVERAINLAKTCHPSAVVTYHHVQEDRGTEDLHRCDDSRAGNDMQQAWKRHAMNSPVVQYYLCGGTDPVVATQELISDRQLRGSSLYEECWKPFDVTHQVGLRVWGKRYVGGLSIKRDGNFSDDEQRLLRALHPHFIRAWESSSYADDFKAELGIGLVGDHGSVEISCSLKLEALTVREREVLHWISEGKRNREIGLILGTSIFTVNTQVENILRKLNVETRGAAAAIWLRCSESKRVG